MPAFGASRGYPTENQPLSTAQQYMASGANAPPTSVYGGGYSPATNPNTPSATIGGGTPYSGAPMGQPAPQTFGTPPGVGYQAPSTQPGQTGAYGPNIIGNNLPWNLNASGNMMNALSADPATTIANIGPAYKSAYDDYLKFSMDQTNNINAGYGQTAQNQFLGQQQTQAGYGQLSSDVLGGIAGIGSDQRALLTRQYQQQRGNAMQGLINSGLGNSTVTSSVNRGIGLDEALAGNNLANSIAQTRAGYQSNLGLAGLGYQGQSVRDNTGLATHQLDWMNSITAKAPDASLYGNIASQAGAAIQSNANRAQIDRLASQNSDLGAQVRQAAVLGGSGGTQPGTGGRLPLSSINYGAGASSPGAGGGLSFGSDFFTAPGARSPGTGGGGAMQQASAPRGGSSGGFGSGLAGAPGVTNYLGGGAGGMLGGAGMAAGTGSAADLYNQQAALAMGGAYSAAIGAIPGGGYGFSDPSGAGNGYATEPGGAYYDQPGAADVSYGLGSDLFSGAYDQPNYYSPQPGAADVAYGLGSGAFAGADMFGYGGDSSDEYDYNW